MRARGVFSMAGYNIVLLFLFLLITIPITSAVPSLGTYNNSISTNLYPHQNIGTNIIFNISANEVITTWTWMVDGTDAGNNAATLTKSWTTSGQKNVTVYGTNGNGKTGLVTWFPVIERQKTTASDTTASLNTSWYDSLLSSFSGSSPSLLAFATSLTLPFTNKIGNLFYLFLYGLPMLIIWIRQEKALIPAGLGIIFGAFFLGQLPESYIGVAVLFMILTVFGVLYSLYKERG